MARLGPPFWPQNPPEKSLCGSFFLRPFQEMRHINFFLGAQNGGVLGGGQKVYVEDVYVLFRPPTIEYQRTAKGASGKGPRQKKSKSVKIFSTLFDIFRAGQKTSKINSVHTRCIVKTSGFTRGVCKNRGDFIKFKGFLVEFLENRRSWENQKPPENRQKSGLFWASPFTMHLVCTLLNKEIPPNPPS